MRRVWSKFLKREDGVVAIIFAVMAIPFFAMAGWAVDYLRLEHVKEYLQIQADTAALNATHKDDPQATNWEQAQWDRTHSAIMAEINRTYSGAWASNIALTHEWLEPDVRVKVTARADVPLAFMNIVPGIPDTQAVEVVAVVVVSETYWEYSVEATDLDYEAGDYNRVWAYCFWPNRDPSGDLPIRTQMTPIADNAGSSTVKNIYIAETSNPQIEGAEAIVDSDLRAMYISKQNSNINGVDGVLEGTYRTVSNAHMDVPRTYRYVSPLCQGESYFSLRLENVRNQRGDYRYWEVGDFYYASGERYNYYTDTYPDAVTDEMQYGGLELPAWGGGDADILETVLCESLSPCGPASPGRDRQLGAANQRERAEAECPEGSYMYYGWEDRPAGIGEWTDADYDDIRVIISCPTLKSMGDQNPRLVG